jgi:hypothetical protein
MRLSVTFLHYVLIMVMVLAPLRPGFAAIGGMGAMNDHCNEKHHSSYVMAGMNHHSHDHQAMANTGDRLIAAQLSAKMDGDSGHKAVKHCCCCDKGCCGNGGCSNLCGMHINQTVLTQPQQVAPRIIQTDAISDLVYTLIHRNLTPPDRPPLLAA